MTLSSTHEREPLSRSPLSPRLWVEGYGAGSEMPLGGYAALLAVYGVAFGTGLAAIGPKGLRRIPLGDLALLAIATHKVARIVTRDWVTAPIRAPFTQYEKSAGSGEVEEKSRGEGLRRAVGDLLTCPWCIGPWVAGAFVLSFEAAPAVTRTVATVFTAVTVSDFLHVAYGKARGT